MIKETTFQIDVGEVEQLFIDILKEIQEKGTGNIMIPSMKIWRKVYQLLYYSLQR